VYHPYISTTKESEVAERQRDVSFELERSTRYAQLEDEELFILMNYWYSERLNFNRMPKEQSGITAILGRLAAEITCRGQEEASLERQAAAGSFVR
jgi:hypothetical protein